MLNSELLDQQETLQKTFFVIIMTKFKSFQIPFVKQGKCPHIEYLPATITLMVLCPQFLLNIT